MASRPSWEGHLRLSLVTCPVALYPATTEAETVHFHMINPATGNRIHMQTVDAGTGEEVPRSKLVKGFEVAKDEYVLLDPEDFDKVKLESTRIIDIEKFVTRSSIDRLYWDTPYHLGPSGKTGIEAFSVIRAAMDRKETVAIGRLVMSTRERICAIEIEESGLLLTTLRTAEEVRTGKSVPHTTLPRPEPKMLTIAEQIVEQMMGKFDPDDFVDRYEDALRELIEEKKKGHVIKAPAPANDDGKVIDLMAALRDSLKGKGSTTKEDDTRHARKTPRRQSKPKRRRHRAA